jgi:hypothetical protein
MSAHASRTAVHTDNSPADFAGSAFESVRAGAHELQERAAEALPATSHFLGRVVYKTSYALAFGVTFPVMMVVRVIPKDNALVHGLVDGAIAARDRVDEWRGEVDEDLHESEGDLARAFDNGSAHHDEDSSKHTTHRRTKAKRSGTRKTTRAASRKKS